MTTAAAPLAALALLAAAPVAAADCRPDRPADVRPSSDCAPARSRADRARAGRPGFIDLGNGTEVRIGGRVRIDHEGRR